jgi:hypothetical protein
MGADMTLACAPACNLTPQRVRHVEQVVRAIPDADEDLRELMEALSYDDAAQAKRQIIQCSLESQEEGREVTTLHVQGYPYPLQVSGGLSWGDPPTELYTVLEHVARCPQLWQVLEEFARADAVAAALKLTSSLAPAAEPRNFIVVMSSDKVGTEHFHYPSLREALGAIRRLVCATRQRADGSVRWIGILVNADESSGGQMYGANSAGT